jgi:ComF family protein
MVAVSSVIKDFAHLFFPHVCAGCGTDVISLHAPVCARCINRLPFTNFHLYSNNTVEKYFWGRMEVTGATALCHFTGGSLVQQLLHQLKYKGNTEVGYIFGRMLGSKLNESERFSGIDMLVPLPLFAARQKKRGYNQSAIICNGAGAVMNLPVNSNAVARLSATETQTRKNRIDRWKNMEGKFEVINAASLAGKHILLVDDVITTGATLEACGQAILEIPGTKLSIATLAYTV